ncbi:hypothetical protein GCM10007874_08540 [Labrys miyagiensis]|uniref:DUF535 domain-containing protein n=1 Tax=Labrys miyagiensis TaxID=346912 RepID=A0ABQ6CDG8_9HYPH|nr:DUF535 family protein [Labrys miyagiensis]GLS17839.1 hypothetical protein GCM10007874_08540 [Labrys miyagiensis]
MRAKSKSLTQKLRDVALLNNQGQGERKIVGRIKRVCDLFSHPVRHRRVAKALSKPVFRNILKRQPQLTIKYLHYRHLVRGISTDERAATMIHHYDFLGAKFASAFVATVLDKEACLWDYPTEAGRHRVVLKFSDPTDNEGELTFEYQFEGVLIYLLSFSFAPGSLAGLPAETVVLLTRLQGTKSDFELLRTAMKSLRGLSAPAVLIAALHGLADGLGLVTILGVSAEAQVCYYDGQPSVFVAAYDDFFTSLGGSKLTSKFYALALPLVEKPIDEVKSNNRSRTRAQRDLKKSIAGSVQDAIMQNLETVPGTTIRSSSVAPTSQLNCSLN